MMLCYNILAKKIMKCPVTLRYPMTQYVFYRVIPLRKSQRVVLTYTDMEGCSSIPESIIGCLESTLGTTVKVIDTKNLSFPAYGCLSLPIEANMLISMIL